MTKTKQIVDAIKLAAGCELCGYREEACALDFDHLNPDDKYRTRHGRLVDVADMVKGERYGLATILAEIAKCRVLCAICHRVHTHRVQRGR